ncbi:MAG: hypothetical protein QOH06_82 [Acidobacteriota bacterium]|jgi:uncharacterized membrane protein|nr:hypothetical protein [Acidobacteriota bacterium]
MPVKHEPHHWRSRLRTLLLGGLLILAPAYLTVYVLVLLFRFMDGIFARLIDKTLSTFLEKPGIHIPGLGIVLTLLVILFLGWLSTGVLGRRMIDSVEAFIRRIPIARSVYGATKGVLEAVSRDQADAFKRVVLVQYPRIGTYGIGFVTGGPSRWSASPHDMELVPVFVPTTPNPTGGFLLLVPPREIVEIPVTVEEGIRMVVSGGILLPALILDQERATAAKTELVGREF